jgi:hypothetical protein
MRFNSWAVVSRSPASSDGATTDRVPVDDLVGSLQQPGGFQIELEHSPDFLGEGLFTHFVETE